MNKETDINTDKQNKPLTLKPKEHFEIITHSEINQYLFHNLSAGIISSLILASVLFVELLGFIDKTTLVIWYGCVILVLGMRTILLIWFNRTKLETKLQNYHSNFFIVSSCLTAILWGILGSFLMPANIFYQTFIIIFISGIVAGSTISLGANYLASMLYVFFSLLPIIIWEGIQVLNGNRMYLGIFIAMSIYLLYSSITSRKNSQLVIKNIKLKNKNEDLLERLTKYLNQIELFSRMGESLEQCRSDQEIGRICKMYLPQIFREFSGGIFLLSAASMRLRNLETWGEFSYNSQALDFSRDECLAIKNKTFHISNNLAHCIHCLELSTLYVCMPLQTPLDFYGILCLKLNPNNHLHTAEVIASQKPLISRIATNISFALSTIQYQLILESEATHDKLTGLYNRRYLDNYFDTELARTKRKSAPISVIMIDIDHFKMFNDRYGHETGDKVLHALGSFLKKSVRGSDFACRYGGEEFMLILPESGLDIARERAEYIREGVKRISILKDDKPIYGINVSIGVSIFPEHGDTQAKVIEAADKALYLAKETGRDKVCIANV